MGKIGFLCALHIECGTISWYGLCGIGGALLEEVCKCATVEKEALRFPMFSSAQCSTQVLPAT